MIRNKIGKFLREKGISQAEAQRQTGIARSSLARIYRNEVININLDTLDTICKTFGCDLTDLFEFVPDAQMTKADHLHVEERKEAVEQYSTSRRNQRERREMEES